MRLKTIMGVVLAIIIIIQLIPLNRENPPVTQWVETTAEVKPILERACFDCHSNVSNWPWYAYVAPVSFLIVRDVHRGREFLNFSEWDRYDEFDIMDTALEIEGVLDNGSMPFPPYLIMHSEARLSEADKQALITWGHSLPGMGKRDSTDLDT